MVKLLFAPAFNGHSEMQFDKIGAFFYATIIEQLRHPSEVIAQILGELSAAGGELIQVASTLPTANEKCGYQALPAAQSQKLRAYV
jgi:hypothetical protein